MNTTASHESAKCGLERTVAIPKIIWFSHLASLFNAHPNCLN